MFILIYFQFNNYLKNAVLFFIIYKVKHIFMNLSIFLNDHLFWKYIEISPKVHLFIQDH